VTKYSFTLSTLFQLFRCHKAFLASNSEAFEKMLFGSFKEANAHRDFEICILDFSPAVFELAMRYINFSFCFKSCFII
jgi:BTB/POZ domain